MIRGDLLVYTNKEIKRIDKINENDKILNDNLNTIEIDSIEKKNVKNYYLYKIKTNNNIDNYYLDANNKIYTIQNIPYNLKMNECVNYIEEHLKYCSPSFKNIKDITDFDYIGFPYNCNNSNNNDNNNQIISQDDIDKYRFQGLFLLFNKNNNNKFDLDNNLNRNTIGFLNKYLHNNNIKFELNDNNITSTIIINDLSSIQLLTTEELLNLSYIQTLHLIKGFNEINSSFNINDKNQFYLIKFLYMKIGFLISANYNKNTNNYIIKIPNINDINSDKNYFIYDNYIWTKIKRIEKVEKFTGVLYKLNMKNKESYLSEIGIIS